jgi:hypothetical protein
LDDPLDLVWALVRVELREPLEFRKLQRIREPGERDDGESHPPVSCPVEPIRRRVVGAGEPLAAAWSEPSSVEEVHQRLELEVKRGFQEACLDLLATPGLLPGQERRRHSEGQKSGGMHVHNRGAGRGRGVVRSPRDAGQPALGLDDQVLPRARPVGALRPEASGGAVDEARIEAGQGLVVEPQALHDARPVVFHHDVAEPRQAVDNLPAPVLLEVECETALAAIEAEKKQAFPPDERIGS